MSWGALTTAKGIDLSGNQITGTLPSTWGGLSSLQASWVAIQQALGMTLLRAARGRGGGAAAAVLLLLGTHRPKATWSGGLVGWLRRWAGCLAWRAEARQGKARPTLGLAKWWSMRVSSSCPRLLAPSGTGWD